MEHLCGNVYRKGARKGTYMCIYGLFRFGYFSFGLTFWLVFTLPDEGGGRAKAQRWTCEMDIFRNETDRATTQSVWNQNGIREG